MGPSTPSSPAPPAHRSAASGLDRVASPLPRDGRSDEGVERAGNLQAPSSEAWMGVIPHGNDNQPSGTFSNEAIRVLIQIVALQAQIEKTRLSHRSTPSKPARRVNRISSAPGKQIFRGALMLIDRPRRGLPYQLGAPTAARASTLSKTASRSHRRQPTQADQQKATSRHFERGSDHVSLRRDRSRRLRPQALGELGIFRRGASQTLPFTLIGASR